MSYGIEKVKPQVEVSTTPISSRPNPHTTLPPLQMYQMLVGDVDKPSGPNDDSLYCEIQTNERKAFHIWVITSLCFGILILVQVVLCLGIAIGATASDSNLQISRITISVLAGTNTGVATLIGILKALGLPDKKGLERRKWQKLAEQIRHTTRRLKIGLHVDVEKAAGDVMKAYDTDADEEATLGAAEKLGNAAGAQKE